MSPPLQTTNKTSGARWLILNIVCSQVSRHVANHLKAEQGKWNAATQQRISATGSVLGAIKNIKMLGMQQTVAGYVEDLRKQELDAARGVRWLMVGYNASGKLTNALDTQHINLGQPFS